ncbi:MAG: hypothetical protein V1787_06100 [Candidatus Micrarchaeota archaeon]
MRAQFSFEALLLIAAYAAFIAVLVSAASSGANHAAMPDPGAGLCRALSSAGQQYLAVNVTRLPGGENLTECGNPAQLPWRVWR